MLKKLNRNGRMDTIIVNRRPFMCLIVYHSGVGHNFFWVSLYETISDPFLPDSFFFYCVRIGVIALDE